MQVPVAPKQEPKIEIDPIYLAMAEAMVQQEKADAPNN